MPKTTNKKSTKKKTGKTQIIEPIKTDPNYDLPLKCYISAEILKLLLAILNEKELIFSSEEEMNKAFSLLGVIDLENTIKKNYTAINEDDNSKIYRLLTNKKGMEEIESFLKNYLDDYIESNLSDSEIFEKEKIISGNFLPYNKSQFEVLSFLEELRKDCAKNTFSIETEKRNLHKNIRLYEILIDLYLRDSIAYFQDDRVELLKDLAMPEPIVDHYLGLMVDKKHNIYFRHARNKININYGTLEWELLVHLIGKKGGKETMECLIYDILKLNKKRKNKESNIYGLEWEKEDASIKTPADKRYMRNLKSLVAATKEKLYSAKVENIDIVCGKKSGCKLIIKK